MVSTLREPLRLHERSLSVEEYSDRVIDIVAVHGLCETSKTAWLHPDGNHNWLQEWLPIDLQVARILTFDYNSSPQAFFEETGIDQVERTAQTLVQNIHTHRSLEDGTKRPIVFVCHGLGGVIVKKALIYSSLQTSAHVQHLYTVYVSTFAILFFGVPHHALDRSIWMELEQVSRGSGPTTSGNDTISRPAIHRTESETLHGINTAFAPLMKQFRVFFFWEELKTQLSSNECFIVDSASAAPEVANTERMAIFADHVSMVKFTKKTSSEYRAVHAALARYCREAPSVIGRRWQIAEDYIHQARSNEAYELAGVIYKLEDNSRRPSTSSQARKLDKDRMQLPRRPDRDFVGRAGMVDELLTSFWIKPFSGQKVYVLHGMGGAGKTEIGIKFARDHQLRYSAIFTINASDADSIKASFAQVGKCGGLEATEKSGKYWLEQFDEPWLLIVDNADDPNLDLVSLFPDCEHGHILVTTRNPEFRRHSTVGDTLVGELTRDEALQLLFVSAQISGPPWKSNEESAAGKIVKALGYLALALKAAGTAIYRRICQLHDYLDYHQHYCDEYQSKLGAENDLSDDDARTYAVFDISSRWLESRSLPGNLDALQLLNIVAFLHFEHIPIDIFHRAIEYGQAVAEPAKKESLFGEFLESVKRRLKPPRARPNFLCREAKVGFGYRLNKALRTLRSLSIIFYDGDDEKGRNTFSLHPVVHAWTKSRLKRNEQKLWAQIALNLLTDSITLPTGTAEDEVHISYYRKLVPHLNSCVEACPFAQDEYNTIFSRFQMTLAPIMQPTLLAIIGEKTLDAAKCGYLYLTCGYFEKSVRHFSITCSGLLSLLGPLNDKTTKAQLGLAHAFWGLGQLDKAIDIQQSVVNARTRRYGSAHRDTLLAKDYLARSNWLNGQYKEALDLQEETVAHMRKVLSRTDAHLLGALDNLGVIYGSWHRFQESLEVHQIVFNIRLEAGDAASEEVLSTRMYLAMAMLGVGNLTAAQSEMTQVYEARKLRLGKEHPWTLWALCYLAKIKVKMKQLNDAERMLDEGIAAGRRSLSDDHLGVLMGRGEMARVYSRQGRFEDASRVLQDTVARLEISRGLEHPDHVYGLWKLAQLRVKQGRLREAVGHCERALELAKGRLTLAHPLAELIKVDLEKLTQSD